MSPAANDLAVTAIAGRPIVAEGVPGHGDGRDGLLPVTGDFERRPAHGHRQETQRRTAVVAAAAAAVVVGAAIALSGLLASDRQGPQFVDPVANGTSAPPSATVAGEATTRVSEEPTITEAPEPTRPRTYRPTATSVPSAPEPSVEPTTPDPDPTTPTATPTPTATLPSATPTPTPTGGGGSPTATTPPVTLPPFA